ncbi:MAG TPA: SDR family oxidoreductase [Abditibacterium sp.]|jgi:NAD(P)-dependent dehydrogenase (short-subunit alcohol dehydrogenase family)
MMKIGLITGANKGIGLETARQLGALGITTLIGSRDANRGQEAVAELQKEGIDAQFLLLDVADAASIAVAAREVEARFGRLDILINNAASLPIVDRQDAAFQVSTDVFREIFEVNVFGLHEVTRAFWPLLEKSDAARLVNVSSALGSLKIQSEIAPGGHRPTAYGASKAAVNMMTLHYAHQWAGTPHRANAVHPGGVKTDLNPQGGLSPAEGAKSSVEMALIPADGPNGSFTHFGETLPW